MPIISPSIGSSPCFITSKLSTTNDSADQVILSYTPSNPLYLSGFSVYVWDTMMAYQVLFGEASLESPPGTKLYTSQLTSMGGGRDHVAFGQILTFPVNQEIRVVCSPSAPIHSQTWQVNLIAAA